jgi:hypothetical protein
MLRLADLKELLQVRREFDALRVEWKRALDEYYGRKFDPNQPRMPKGSSVWAADGQAEKVVLERLQRSGTFLIRQKNLLQAVLRSADASIFAFRF